MRIIVSRKKYKSGKFHIFSSQPIRPNNISLNINCKYYFSENSRVLAVLSQLFYG